jgi:hypothetical protein
MLKYFISFLLTIAVVPAQAQSESIDLQPKDTIVYKQPYGLRAGIDLSRVLQGFLNDDYTGLEIVGDYRLTENLYVAGELGNEKKTNTEELQDIDVLNSIPLYNYTTSGSYLKVGVDYNTYENWYGMNNTIFIGGRYAISSFSQTLNNYSVFDSNRYWSADQFAPGAEQNIEYSGLTASWLEFVFGMKAELFANIYLGASVRIGFLVSNKESETFPNLWIPGFNKVTDGSNFGIGYNYSLTYFLPLYKKSKKPTPEVE